MIFLYHNDKMIISVNENTNVIYFNDNNGNGNRHKILNFNRNNNDNTFENAVMKSYPYIINSYNISIYRISRAV